MTGRTAKRGRRCWLSLVADADRLLALARQAWVELPEDSAQRQSIVAGAELLGQLLLQDVERKSGNGDVDADADAADDGVSVRDGVSKDRMPSVHDPELRHGHKSSRRRFNGHKAAIVVDTDSQLITAVDVLPGNAPDNLGALELVEASEASTGSVVEEAMGDVAYGDGGTRQAFADAGRRLVAKVPGRPDRNTFPRMTSHLDLAAGSCTCPAGQVTRTIVPAGKRTDRTGRVYRLQAFQFDGAACRVCPLRSQCIAAQGRQGRRVLIHPQEALLQQARALQQSAAYDEYRARRVVVEHRLARLVQLGIRQARYFGRVKTKFQLYLAATVANLTLVAGKIGLLGSTDGGAAGHRVVRNDVQRCGRQCGGQFQRRPARTTMVPDLAHVGFTPATPLPNQGFPARFLVEAGHSVLFAPAYRLVQELLAAKRDLDLPRQLRKLDNFDFLLLDDLGYLPQGAEESEVLFTLIAERYERRSLGITSNLVFSEWERIFANPMATAAAIDRVVHHSVILEFDVPSYRTDAAQQRGQAKEVNRQN